MLQNSKIDGRMSIRRIVTGHKDGRSTILSDGPAPTEHKFTQTPGMMTSIIWAHGTDSPAEQIEGAPIGTTATPSPGQTRVIVVELPPDSVMVDPSFDPALAVKEQSEHLPNFIEYFEFDSPGMHRTPTLDFGIVLDGEIWLELDDGQQTLVRTGDVVVQQRTRHAWRNRSRSVVRLAFTMIGLKAEPGAGRLKSQEGQ